MALMALRQLQSNRSADTKLREQARYAQLPHYVKCSMSAHCTSVACATFYTLLLADLNILRCTSDRLYPSRSSAYPSTLSAPAWTSLQKISGQYRYVTNTLVAKRLTPSWRSSYAVS